MRPSSRRSRLGLALLAPVLLALSACAGSSSTGASASGATSGAASSSADAVSPTAAFPVTVTGANGPLTLKAAPEQIVVMGPSLTETLFALGAGAQVEAVDDNSNHPAEAPTTKLSAFQPNAEAVAAYKPDLVVVTNDANGLVASLTKLAIPALVLPAPKNLDEAYEQMRTLGAATGHADDAEKVVMTTKDRIAKAVASVPASAKGKKVYHELDQTFYSVTSATFIGSLYTQFGLTNIADAATGAAEAGGYPQLSAEYIVTAAPDLIVLADTKCCQQDAATVAKRPGFAAVPAVKNGAVLAADDDIASRWGPRIADFAESVATHLQKAA
ncbi:MAG: ABC transporter substrate-binding protein [Kineosporiaceae bacterium]|nr:ABC transporter substrate-binding protein [Kineosporiaceae bacterium]